MAWVMRSRSRSRRIRRFPSWAAPVQMHIYQHVREDILALYGFPTKDDKSLFEKLIAVSGIGPKLAITALSGLTTGDLMAAIRSGAVEQLVRIPGVGKKTAERMVLELRDKLGPATTAQGGASRAQERFHQHGRGCDFRADEFRRYARVGGSGGDEGAVGKRIQRIRCAVPAGAKIGAVNSPFH